ncbi:MAG TPA: hypothetical protein VFC56_02885 [Stellaceae bacterium]|nr:hypothetical protein [Stellaceae bacterium]
MQDVAGPVAAFGEPVEQIAEITRIGLVGADILGGVDRVEGHPEPLVAGGETGAIDVRQDHQPVEPLEVGKRSRRVRKRRPVADRAAEPLGFRCVRRAAPVFGEAAMHARQQPRIDETWRFPLQQAFGGAKRGQRRVARRRVRAARDERLQCLPDAALPIDQRAVAIEA